MQSTAATLPRRQCSRHRPTAALPALSSARILHWGFLTCSRLKAAPRILAPVRTAHRPAVESMEPTAVQSAFQGLPLQHGSRLLLVIRTLRRQAPRRGCPPAAAFAAPQRRAPCRRRPRRSGIGTTARLPRRPPRRPICLLQPLDWPTSRLRRLPATLFFHPSENAGRQAPHRPSRRRHRRASMAHHRRHAILRLPAPPALLAAPSAARTS